MASLSVMVIGGGGREHALAWKLAQSEQVGRVVCVPGNDGMEGIECLNLSHAEIPAFCQQEEIALVMVGPEAPLCAGIVNDLRAVDIPVFGPDREAAQLEGSKDYAKQFMERHGIPTGASATFHDQESALAYLAEQEIPIVIKADGLAAGKGVTVALTREQAEEAVRSCFAGAFGEAGHRVLIEEFLEGEEASILAFVDHNTIKPLASSQDHKPVGEGDTGPNTGGMGAYSPAPVVDAALWEEIHERVLQPFLKGCQTDGLDFRGIIYAGLMVTPKGTKVLEFNVRFGDPETQAVLYRLESDLAEALLATVENRLADYDFVWSEEPAVCVVLASGGYPGSYKKGHAISGLEQAAATGATVFHAGTKRVDGALTNNGGRVLGVTARGTDIAKAVENAYRAVDCISWQDVYCRRDIAHRAIARTK